MMRENLLAIKRLAAVSRLMLMAATMLRELLSISLIRVGHFKVERRPKVLPHTNTVKIG